MTQNRRRSTPTKKAVAKKTTDPKQPEMMDPSAVEVTDNAPITFKERTAYALETLVAEVESIFPSVIYEVTDRNGRGVALGVQFVQAEQMGLAALIDMLVDERVLSVTSDTEYSAVLLHANPVTQDSREPFGLIEAWDLLMGEGDAAQDG